MEAVFNDPSMECGEVLAPPRRQVDSPLCVVELGCYVGLPQGVFYKIADSCEISGTDFVKRLAPRGWHYSKVSRSEARSKSMAVLTNRKFYCLSKEKLEFWQERWALHERCHWPHIRRYDRTPTSGRLVRRPDNLLTNPRSRIQVAVAGFFSTTYRCLHLLAWFIHFPLKQNKFYGELRRSPQFLLSQLSPPYSF